MNKSERKELSLNMAVLMKSVINKELNQEEVANVAISFCREILINFPDIKDMVEQMVCDDWDSEVAWIKWEREMLFIKNN